MSQNFSFEPTHASAVTTYEIVTRLARRGHKLTVFVPNVDSSELTRSAGSELKKSGNVRVVTFTSLPSRKIQKNLVSYGLVSTAWYLSLLIKALRYTKFDVIISMYHPTHMATYFAYLISRILHVPLIAKTHDVILDMRDPDFIMRIYKIALASFLTNVLRSCDSVLVVSQELKKICEEAYGLESERVLFFPNGVDVNLFKPRIKCDELRKRLELKDEKVILFIGRLHRSRGLDLLIRALPAIVKEEENVKVILVGEGPEKDRLMNLAKGLNVERFILNVEAVSHRRIPEYISLADVTIGPLMTLHTTLGAFPLKVLEYMACGKSVVAVRGSVSKGLIINGYNGVLVDPENEKDLSSAILILLRDDELRGAIERNARSHVEKFYNWSELIGDLEATVNHRARARFLK